MALGFVRAKFVVLVPVAPSEVPPGSVFLDSTNGDVVTVKDPGGGGSAPVGGDASYFLKSMIAGAGGSVAGQPAAKASTGHAVLDDSDGGLNRIGSFLETKSVGEAVQVLLDGPNLAGALTSLGFTTGELVYQGETPGAYVKESDLAGFSGGNDTVRILGVADCAGGGIGGTAVDLIAIPQVVAFP